MSIVQFIIVLVCCLWISRFDFIPVFDRSCGEVHLLLLLLFETLWVSLLEGTSNEVYNLIINFFWFGASLMSLDDSDCVGVFLCCFVVYAFNLWDVPVVYNSFPVDSVWFYSRFGFELHRIVICITPSCPCVAVQIAIVSYLLPCLYFPRSIFLDSLIYLFLFSHFFHGLRFSWLSWILVFVFLFLIPWPVLVLMLCWLFCFQLLLGSCCRDRLCRT